jgi:hypothetical protein
MPQDNQRSDIRRAERSRSQKSLAAIAEGSAFEPMTTKGVTAGLHLQQKMFEVLSNIGREWLSRATSEVELASRLPNKLTAARSVPDAFSAYQEWLGEWMNMRGEDSYRLVSDSQRIINASVRCFADTGPTGAS